MAPALAVLGVAGCTATGPREARTSVPASPATARTPSSPTPTPTPTFDKTLHSIDDPRSPWVVVDKHRPLHPITYVPPDLVAPRIPHTNPPLLRKEAAAAAERLFAGAKADGVHLVSTSTYRSYAVQKQILASDTAQGGAAYADRIDMRPGYSEHQTGWAIDIGSSTRPAVDFDGRMAGTPEGRWLAANAWKHGFHLSYPKDRESITGISFEPWHFRYVGTPLATELHRTGARARAAEPPRSAAPGPPLASGCDEQVLVGVPGAVGHLDVPVGVRAEDRLAGEDPRVHEPADRRAEGEGRDAVLGLERGHEVVRHVEHPARPHAELLAPVAEDGRQHRVLGGVGAEPEPAGFIRHARTVLADTGAAVDRRTVSDRSAVRSGRRGFGTSSEGTVPRRGAPPSTVQHAVRFPS
jgi:D-alanyl-D-alanine carboxypeptidase